MLAVINTATCILFLRMLTNNSWLSAFYLVHALAVGGPPPLTADEVVARLVAMEAARAQALRSYTVICTYHVENQQRRADLVARMTYRWPDEEQFTVISQSGSSVLQKLVLKRAMESEKESTRTAVQRASAINPDNYVFDLVGSEPDGKRQFYVLTLTPKANSKFCFRGRIWVDDQDFAVVREEGQPARNPSWWLKGAEFRQSFKKVGDFWLTDRMESRSQVRLFGSSALTIDYTDYKILDAYELVFPPTKGKDEAGRALRRLGKERARITRLIGREFERIEPDE